MTRPWERWWRETANIDHMRTPEQLAHPVRKAIADEAIGESVLDVGCATCIDYPLFRDAGFRYTGVDITEKFIKRAKEYYPEVDARVVDALALPFPDGSYDTVYCKDLLEHLPPEKWKAALSEMWRTTVRMMMFALYIKTSLSEPTEYRISKGGFYVNRYNRLELLGFIRTLKGVWYPAYHSTIKGELNGEPLTEYELYRVPKSE